MLGGDKRSYILKQTFNQDFLVFFKYVCPFVTTSIKRGKEHHQLSIQLGGKVGPSPGMPGPPGTPQDAHGPQDHFQSPGPPRSPWCDVWKGFLGNNNKFSVS